MTLADKGKAGERTILTSREGNLSHEAFFRLVGEIAGVHRRQVMLPRQVAVAAARIVPWPVRAEEVSAAANWWFFDPAKAERELSFHTRPLDETIADTVAQYLRS